MNSALAMAGTSRTIGHLYDAEGNRTRITHPDTSFFPYAYDGLDRFLRVRENGGDVLVAFTYDTAGRRSGLTSGGSVSAYTYDPVGRLQSLNYNLVGTSGDQVIGLGYNPASQIVTRSGTNDAYAWTGSVAVNRPYSVNGQNQYIAAGPASFAYDANGNLISDGSTAFVYDVENRLVSASGAKTASLAYDPLGRLWQVSSPATGTTRFLYDDDALIDEYDGSGSLLRRYIHGAGKGVDDPLIWYEVAVAGWRRALVADQQGSIVAVADRYGNPVAINAYDEYGIPGANNQGRFQYTGQAWIPELGMFYYKARIYSPTLGRFLQTDPIGYEDQVNLYAYVGNDPVNGTDPTGMECNKERSTCWSDNFVASQARVDVTHNPLVDAAVAAASGDYQNAVKGGEPTGTAKIKASGVEVTTTASKAGSTATGDTAKFNISGADAAVHGHLGGSVVDDPSSNHGYGDTQALEQDKPIYTVEGNRVGVHDAPGGHLRFEMTRGIMTKTETKEIQRNLNRQQKIFLKKKG